MYYVIDHVDNPSLEEDEESGVEPFLEFHEELYSEEDIEAEWHIGSIIQPVPKHTFQIQATPLDGYEGPPPDYRDASLPLMSPRLKKVLDDNGVTNIEYFPAQITYTTTGEKFDWYVFNIVGLMSVADESASDITNADGPTMIDSSINGFKVDSQKTLGHYIFRLADNVMTVLIHQDLKKAIDEAGINTFSFKKPEEWVII